MEELNPKHLVRSTIQALEILFFASLINYFLPMPSGPPDAADLLA